MKYGHGKNVCMWKRDFSGQKKIVLNQIQLNGYDDDDDENVNRLMDVWWY